MLRLLVIDDFAPVLQLHRDSQQCAVGALQALLRVLVQFLQLGVVLLALLLQCPLQLRLSLLQLLLQLLATLVELSCFLQPGVLLLSDTRALNLQGLHALLGLVLRARLPPSLLLQLHESCNTSVLCSALSVLALWILHLAWRRRFLVLLRRIRAARPVADDGLCDGQVNLIHSSLRSESTDPAVAHLLRRCVLCILQLLLEICDLLLQL
mmetsp:Transcript_111433/g.193148  ORF Transcript_111433/g.193148 Transcript_111433/m.193148 type:complete len:210 (+) Transcript_111433:452-1081(+)